jgi:threonine dehydrogenase-like Zn-dependent dehydrogenase
VRALTFRGVRDIRYETVPDPRIQAPGDAIVRVERAGLCGSDLHVYHGREVGIDSGTVMGHEFVGRVVETGPEAAGLAKGARVVAPFTTCCGRCFYCLRGLSARCTSGALLGWVQDGAGLEGAQAEYVRVPLAATSLVAIEDDVPAEVALLLADVVPTGWHVARMGDAGPDSVVVVLGCGPIGLAAVASAMEQGARRVFAVDSVAERLALAERFGAEPLDLSGANGGVVGAVRDATGGRGADSVLEVVGSEAAVRLAFDLVRPGGVVSIAGVHHESRFAFSPVEAYDRNLTLRIGRCPARSLMGELKPWLLRRADLGAIVTHRLPLAQGTEAYRLFDLKQDGCIKVAFTP